MQTKSVSFRLTLFSFTVSADFPRSVGYVVDTRVKRQFVELGPNAVSRTIERARNILAKVNDRSDLDLVPQMLDDARAESDAPYSVPGKVNARRARSIRAT